MESDDLAKISRSILLDVLVVPAGQLHLVRMFKIVKNIKTRNEQKLMFLEFFTNIRIAVFQGEAISCEKPINVLMHISPKIVWRIFGYMDKEANLTPHEADYSSGLVSP